MNNVTITKQEEIDGLHLILLSSSETKLILVLQNGLGQTWRSEDILRLRSAGLGNQLIVNACWKFLKVDMPAEQVAKIDEAFAHSQEELRKDSVAEVLDMMRQAGITKADLP